MRTLRVIQACVLVGLMLVAGCSRPIVQADNPMSLSAGAYEPAFHASIQVLRDYGFTIDRRDYRFGEITTQPLGSPNIFEVWRPQNTTAEQAVESTFASEQRRVHLLLSPVDPEAGPDASGYLIEVRVVLERLQVPTRRLAGSARRNVFSNLAAPPRELADRGVRGNYWEEVGRDPYLEARLIEAISEHLDAGS